MHGLTTAGPWKGPQVPPHYWWFLLCSLDYC
jgi:hypothetical protein